MMLHVEMVMIQLCFAVWLGKMAIVAGFDIQEEAIEKTRNRLRENGLEKRARLFLPRT